ncbi:MAG TPA: hypothetical protein EYP58_01755 [bacterium (Candidatus Stahlbacteria)]|nr:hypothetical protein [Candidatus Stahlbacteria bacterium]
MTYNYLYRDWPDNRVDYIGSAGGNIFFKSQDGLGRGVSYGGLSNSYRAIYSCFLFGALRDSPQTKSDLMKQYLNYLSGN